MLAIDISARVKDIRTMVDLDVFVTTFFGQSPALTAALTALRIHGDFCQFLTAWKLVNLKNAQIIAAF